jgi:hypothetical protein
MPFKDSRFAKPSASFTGPSRHLYISGIGHQTKTPKSGLLSFFSAFGALEDVDGDQGIYMPDAKRYVFVTYVDQAVAEQVFQALTANPTIAVVDAHSLSVKYATLASSKRPPEPECTSTTDHVHVPGALVVEEFISEEEEKELLECYQRGDWKVSLNRRVQVGY